MIADDASSVTSLDDPDRRSYRPSLVWIFHKNLKDDLDYLTREDMRQLLGGESITPTEADEAFDRLDTNKDGKVTLDEFLAGFSASFQESEQSRGNHERTSPFARTGSRRRSFRRRPMQEQLYESESAENLPLSESIKKSLFSLSGQNRKAIKMMWQGLSEANPELVGDFEEFVQEMSEEVDRAQSALDKQRMHVKKDALEMNMAMEQLQTKAHIQLLEEKELLREKVRNRMEQQLQQKDDELGQIRSKLEELESEIHDSRNTQSELKQKYEESSGQRDELLVRLEESEKLLRESQSAMEAMQKKEEERQKGYAAEQEAALAKLKDAYLTDVTELKERLHDLQRNQQLMIPQIMEPEDTEMVEREGFTETTPDLLVDTTQTGRLSPSSLFDEIVKEEGETAPCLRKETMIQSPPESDGRMKQLRQLDFLSLAPLEYDPNLQPQPFQRRSNSMRHRRRHPGRPSSAYYEDSTHILPTSSLLPARGVVKPSAKRPSVTGDRTPKKIENGTPGEIVHSLESSDQEGGDKEGEQEKYERFRSESQVYKPLEFVESFVANPDITFKILIVGNPYVGKSCFLMRLCTNSFGTRYASTIGVDFYSRMIRLEDKTISLQLWDTAGQERFQSVTRAYYRGAEGIILMYDITQEESFIAVRSWINSVQENMEDGMPAAMLLVGNKSDLETNKREVLTETGETFAKIYKADFIETSAKTGFNVGNACLTIVRRLLQEGAKGPQRGEDLTAGNTHSSKCSC